METAKYGKLRNITWISCVRNEENKWKTSWLKRSITCSYVYALLKVRINYHVELRLFKNEGSCTISLLHDIISQLYWSQRQMRLVEKVYYLTCWKKVTVFPAREILYSVYWCVINSIRYLSLYFTFSSLTIYYHEQHSQTGRNPW